MSAKDKREILGVILIAIGLGLLLVGVANGESDYRNLNSTQLAWKTVSEALLPDFTEIGVGFILLLAGIIIFFAPSNKAATRRLKGIIPH